ncbi:MAG TPA: hypothetical protein PLC08_02565 [Candidatus Bipolaricaulis sp.]|nr:hypothetical protein [Candidatus Bipolaricaulis sp.]MDY0392487.1 hypothetical protein [Candidatus Bipolaricaulis sp.]HPD06744.1 hypothetical protein [Candidatus Bipolaricaulis sp.]HRS13465.1 hypothetical protein [Candidatus Bipolaricaulis sp.]HRU22105.1 hypothetical protein [Candidatus Bipolaricaulis sp.]
MEILNISANPVTSFAPLLELSSLRFVNATRILVKLEVREILDELEERGVRVLR